jgi:Lar family restriction alleviation protein
MTAALKPCPFCGGEAVVVDGANIVGRCRSCMAEGPWCVLHATAVNAWNRRVVDPALATFAATLKHAEARAEKAEAALRELAELDCVYGDECPGLRSNPRHGPCVGCRARAALAPTTTEGGAE